MSGTWVPMPVMSGRYATGAVYDPVRRRTLVFGGVSPSGAVSEVWALASGAVASWALLQPAGARPPERSMASTVYDPVRDRLLVLGGITSNSAVLSDVWALSLSGTPTWTQIGPAGTPPSARSCPSVIYDPAQDRLVLYGGVAGGSYQGDVWALSLSGTPGWTRLTPAGAPPSSRAQHAAIHDPVRNRMLVFGGVGAGGYVNDLWELSLGATPAWTPVSAAGTPPSPRSLHTAVYDSRRDRIVVFGGYGAGYLNDAWILSLGATSWSALTPAGAAPAARSAHAAVYDPTLDRMGVFGGAPGFQGDTWTLSLAGAPAWALASAAAIVPPARWGHVGVFQPARRRFVVFAGDLSTGPANDLWALEPAAGPAWTQLSPTGTPPSARYVASAIYDPVRERMIVFGGKNLTDRFGDLWALSLSGAPAWSPIAAVGTPPGVRSAHSAIYDPVRDRMICYGGGNGVSMPDDVWSLTLAGVPEWKSLLTTGSSPGGLAGVGVAYDPVRDRMLFFGGFAPGFVPSAQVWALSLGASPVWTLLAPAGTSPPARGYASTVYDPVRDRLVVYGGLTGSSALSDVWELSLAGVPTWSPLAPGGPNAGARYANPAVYDAARDRMLVHGGVDASLNAGRDDTWELAWSLTLDVPSHGDVSALRLAPAVPNPAREGATIDFALPRAGRASLRIVDVTGRAVRTVVDGPLGAGEQRVRWNCRDATGARVSPGVYFLVLRTRDGDLARRLVVL